MDAIVAVTGTLLGAAIGVAGGYFTSRQQLRHSDRTRWVAEQRDLVVRLLRTFDDARDSMQRVDDDEEAWRLVVAYHHAVSDAEMVLPQVLMAHGQPMVEALDGYYDRWINRIRAGEPPPGHPNHKAEAYHEEYEAMMLAHERRQQFASDARAHFGLN